MPLSAATRRGVALLGIARRQARASRAHIAYVQRLLGHRSPRTSQIYTRTTIAEKMRDARKGWVLLLSFAERTFFIFYCKSMFDAARIIASDSFNIRTKVYQPDIRRKTDDAILLERDVLR